ncbi:glycosyltransferase family 2 protein [Sneathiella litorea]|uniref:Glycosyltransferase n=1 Tax=Sneathiella litorea TaxID=2606216 RepID=A0A6L8W5B3_9PROT|nr:glycosyltransferase family 2 protein [Sneathiella litorea]MZR29692.1 glycosyltransferase [Sneathiella litorea]
MSKETVSVIIPAYNSSDTICETVDSVLNQTRVPDEVIIVDDCGPDDVVAALGDRMERIKYIRHSQNKGVGGARDTGFQASTGSLIAFLDADDLFFPQFIEAASRILDDRPDVPLCFGAFYSAYDHQFASIKDRSIPASPDVRFYRPEEILEAYIYDATSPLINFGLVRRSAIDQILKDGLIFDPAIKLTVDFNYLLELFLKFNLVTIENPCGIWRLRPNSMSQNQLALWESRVDSLKAVLETAAARSATPRGRKLLEDNKHASVRYCAKILAQSGRRVEAVKTLKREFQDYPSTKTLALLVLVALGISYRKQQQVGEDWRGSSIK